MAMIQFWLLYHLCKRLESTTLVYKLEVNIRLPVSCKTQSHVKVNVQFEKGIRDIFMGVFVSSCVSNEKQTHQQKYL